MRWLALVWSVVVSLATPAVAAVGHSEGEAPAPAAPRAMPALTVTTEVGGLEIPWDVAEIGTGRYLITERTTARLLLVNGGTSRKVGFPSASVWASGETGLMSVVKDPGFASSHRFYTCQGWNTAGGGHDIRVIAWRLDAGPTATKVKTLLTGIPTKVGRHGGCRLLISRTGALLVGTGDAAVGRNPQNKRSLGGKVLRLNRLTGAPWPDNPWPHAADRRKRYVLTYGHRNVQGLAQRNDGSLWSVEHGPDRNDEVNLLRRGGNYGWNPVPGYNENVPMTDFTLPGKQWRARWRSGFPTLATSGGTWVYGSQWGRLEGTLAVACLKSNQVVFMKFDATGHLVWTRRPAVLQSFGRLRSIHQIANGDLLVTTSNGTGDKVLRVTPG